MRFWRNVLPSFILFLRLCSTAQGAAATPSICHPDELDIRSCSAESLTADSCCVESPGGLIVQTQLYNWNPGLGPEDSWTIHGLWPDYCNGSYPSSCDPSREYANLSRILEEHHSGWLVDYFDTYWKNDAPITTVNGTDADLWAHEWLKHGTCMSTLRPACYPHYTEHMELVQYLTATYTLFRELPTMHFLNACEIVPSNETTYSLESVERCLVKATGGFVPHVGCSPDGYLNEVWYYFHLRGRIGDTRGGDARFEGTNTTFTSACPAAGIKYPPKLKSSRSGTVESTEVREQIYHEDL